MKVKYVSVLMALIFAGSGCVVVKKGPQFHIPPGQMQKNTGYNPASGKFKGQPPGKQKKKNR